MSIMNYNKIITGVLSLCLAASVTGCSDWLDVKQDTVVEEKDQFATYSGFQDALTDCYASLASSSLYGGVLTMGLPDVLANIYQEPNRERATSNYYLYHHDYSQQSLKNSFDNIYTELYRNIVQCNIIIRHTNDVPSVLTEEQRELIAGEAHAVKALCHFEILRLFGPVPTEGATSDIKLYYTDVSDITTRPVECDYTMFVDRIRAEFNEARTLLAGVDPVLKYNFDELNKFGTDGFEYVTLKDEKYTVLRQFRLNYWAVRALQARMELYVGNKAEAGKIAREILAAKTAEGKPLVELSTLKDMSDACLCSPSEGLFLLSVPEVVSTADGYFGFKSTTVDGASINTLPEETLKDVIFDDKLVGEDKRYLEGWKVVAQTGGGAKVPVLLKYFSEEEKDAEVTLKMQTKQQVVPVMRLSELYLMLMETSTDLAEVNRLYKEYMLARNVNLQADAFTTLDAVAAALPREYMREFYGEGIIFYFYKRRAMEKDFLYGMKDFKKEAYVLPFADAQKRAEEIKKAEEAKKNGK